MAKKVKSARGRKQDRAKHKTCEYFGHNQSLLLSRCRRVAHCFVVNNRGVWNQRPQRPESIAVRQCDVQASRLVSIAAFQNPVMFDSTLPTPLRLPHPVQEDAQVQMK